MTVKSGLWGGLWGWSLVGLGLDLKWVFGAVFWRAGGWFDVEVLGEGFEESGEAGAGDAVELGWEGFFGGWGFFRLWGLGFGNWFGRWLGFWGLLRALAAGDVEGGDLEAVEDESGAARVDVVEGDGGEDLAEGVLDVGAGAWFGDGEGVAAGVAGLRVGRGFAGLVVVVAVVLVAEGGAAAAVSVDEDVAAAEVFWDFAAGFGGLFVHGGSLNAEARLGAGLFNRCI